MKFLLFCLVLLAPLRSGNCLESVQQPF